ncbi:FAD-linked oxidase C-terminal domain-containing protein [Pusillimonas sp. SM2304]|uniref:FAD-binding and (Fe-S)-binding domain-containing protein n=1 Tax=Pusillimonas sp. SM2304 TaxID=3073241 RepID=UPI002874B2AE|nr:FAD-linked oxidase C-terminal domain-containing protein [Pusillimonas sp. SM2304]MDS1142063.1 FAD-linked oxidase C-terminal domain-containing protein [Pusillimonas sp. SM2304]
MNAPLPKQALAELSPLHLELATRLNEHTQGEVLFDRGARGRYSTDASIYQIEPVGVLLPRTGNDVAAALGICRELSVPVLARGGGTSQCGQTVGAALVIDNSKYLNRVIDLDLGNMTVTVEPGIVLDHLNAWLKPHGVWFPVDVSTAAQCTLGGMAGNNSCGSRSIAYGNMVHNVVSIDAMLLDGTTASFCEESQMRDAPPRVQAIMARLREIAERERNEIERAVPAVMRRVGGYNLDIFHPQSPRPYTADGRINLAHMLVGSEGTLAYTRQMTLKLSPLPAAKALGVVNFPTFYQAMDMTRHIVELSPCAVELVDRTMIDLARGNPAFRPVIDKALIGEPEAILLVEFAGESSAEQVASLAKLVALMGDLGLPGSVVEMPDASAQKALWEVRKAGLNIMMSMRGDGKPVSFIEDCAVPLEHLAEYTSQLTDVFAKHGTKGTWYAHASVGTLHVRPILDMRNDGARKMRAIAEEAGALVRRYKGAFSGEHGDGLVRSEWVAWQFGPRLTRAFEEIKDAFDPDRLMNPGKIVRSSKMDDASLFRFKPGYRSIEIKPALDWSAWNVNSDPATETVSAPGTGGDPAQGLAKAVEMCNNNGHCRKFDAGTMCPSYRVTRDEQHLTRGRANTLRLALSGQLGPDAFTSDEMRATMELCVSCKGCKRDCPTGVDMAKMKIEFLNQWQQKRGLALKDRLIATLPRWAPWAARMPLLFNLRNHIPGAARLTEKWLGFSAQRSLPAWRRDTFLGDPTTRRREGDSRPAAISGGSPSPDTAEVVLFADTFNNYFEPENLHAARQVLQAAGYKIHIARPAETDAQAKRPLCCGRTYLSAGLVDQAKAEARRVIAALLPFVERGVPVIGLEPSCLLTLRDEFLVMGLGREAEALAAQAYLFEEFLAHELKAGRLQLPLKPLPEKRALLHGHCHQKAFDAVKPVQQILALIPELKVELVESSCCGMAGSFGYEASHYETSMKMAELSLLPALRAADDDTLLVADGTSCRHQIADGLAGRSAQHVARVLQRALA